MFDIQKLVDAMSKQGAQERSNYHATFGDLIDKLKNADESCRITPEIKGIGAYRGYYSDIALCTESGNNAFKSELDYDTYSGSWNKWYEENTVKIEMCENPKELGAIFESLLGMYFDGYKGGYNEITRDKPLWLASDYGNCSDVAIIEIPDDLKLITKTVE